MVIFHSYVTSPEGSGWMAEELTIALLLSGDRWSFDSIGFSWSFFLTRWQLPWSNIYHGQTCWCDIWHMRLSNPIRILLDGWDFHGKSSKSQPKMYDNWRYHHRLNRTPYISPICWLAATCSHWTRWFYKWVHSRWPQLGSLGYHLGILAVWSIAILKNIIMSTLD